MAVVVTGSSDDLIEVDGDISEEFNAIDYGAGQPEVLGFSDGTLLRIVYTRGVWRFTPIAYGSAKLTIDQAPEDDDNNCSDRATLDGNIRWVVQGIDWANHVGRTGRTF